MFVKKSLKYFSILMLLGSVSHASLTIEENGDIELGGKSTPITLTLNGNLKQTEGSVSLGETVDDGGVKPVSVNLVGPLTQEGGDIKLGTDRKPVSVFVNGASSDSLLWIKENGDVGLGTTNKPASINLNGSLVQEGGKVNIGKSEHPSQITLQGKFHQDSGLVTFGQKGNPVSFYVNGKWDNVSDAIFKIHNGNIDMGTKDREASVSLNGAPLTPIPVGGIIDWYRPDGMDDFGYPSNFTVCDGHRIDDAESPFKGHNVPDLRDKFIMGVAKTSDIGKTGGRNEIKTCLTTEKAGSHVHELPDTGGISNASKALEEKDKPYYVTRKDHGWVGDSYLQVQPSTTIREGQHRHVFDECMSTDGEHSHDLVLDEEILPPYYGLLKLIRFK